MSRTNLPISTDIFRQATKAAVRCLRDSLGLTQTEMAKRIEVLTGRGFSVDNIRNWEQDKKSPPSGEYLVVLMRLAAEGEALGEFLKTLGVKAGVTMRRERLPTHRDLSRILGTKVVPGEPGREMKLLLEAGRQAAEDLYDAGMDGDSEAVEDLIEATRRLALALDESDKRSSSASENAFSSSQLPSSARSASKISRSMAK
jgi:DNA-binding transcriptional regulator YiaG